MSLRPHDERMSAEQFDALVKLARLSPRGKGNLAARAVLVDGECRAEAASRASIPAKTLNMTLWRYRKLRELVKQAGG